MRTLRPGFLALLVLAAAGPAQAQSLLSSRGLGLPLVATDGRGVALGSMGIGLVGGELSVVDPAAAARLRIPSVGFSFQTSWADFEGDGASGDFSGTRFPYISLGYPATFGTVTVSFGGLLDQRWTSSSTERIDLDGEGSMGVVTDEFQSDGGISSVRLGLARSLTANVDVGFQIGRNIGDVSRVFTRSFDSLDVGSTLPSFQVGGRWSYRGWMASLGASADLGDVLHVAAAYTWSSDLDALPDENTSGAEATFALPDEIRVGATAVLSPQLRAVVGVHRAGWSSVDGSFEDSGARDTFAWGGGVEWGGASILGKPSQLRLGYRDTPLPFTTDGVADPGESAFSAGLGMDLLTSGDILLARLDFALERGMREAGGFEERFWRLATSVRLSGF